jgi:hypothetical protein
LSVYLYDEAFVEKLKYWTKNTQVQIYSPDDTKRLFEVMADTNNDNPIRLPILCLRRKSGLNVINPNKQPMTFDGLMMSSNNEKSLSLNAIPIDVNYQLDIYTRYFKEADEFLRNLTFNIINYPKLTIKIPYNKSSELHDDIEHNGFIRMSSDIEDNSNIPERLINGQFTRLTFNISIDDAYLWDVKVKDNIIVECDKVDFD